MALFNKEPDKSVKPAQTQPQWPDKSAPAASTTVIADDKSSELESATVTQSFTPSKLNADPNRPDADHTAPDTDPPFPRPDESTTTEPEPAFNPYAATRPAGAELCAAVMATGEGVFGPWPQEPPG